VCQGEPRMVYGGRRAGFQHPANGRGDPVIERGPVQFEE
jgi:hypothetical protein